jgi:hypothetical protein
MSRHIEEPVVTEEPSHGKETMIVERHPAFAQIGVSRHTGRTALYGSNFLHHNTINIRIAASELKRDLSHDWHFAKNQYIEVELSEAQWATMVSSLNVGDGVPCTLRYLRGESIPGLPNPKKRGEQFASEAKETLADVEAHLKVLEEQIGASLLSNNKKKELLSSLRMARMNLGENLKFVADSFAKHVETNVEKAKVEVNAYMTSMIHRAGLEHLGAGPLMLENNKEDSQS